MSDELTPADRISRIRDRATDLASELRDATDAGVSHAVILPQLLIVFREVFGEMPDGFVLPGMPGSSL